MNLARVVICALLLSVPAWARFGPQAREASQSQDVKALKQLEQDWLDAYREGDADKMGKILADDFVGRWGDGSTQTKDEQLRAIRDGEEKHSENELVECNVRLYGETAVVTGIQTEQSILEGRNGSGTYSYTDVFVKRDGRWQVVASETKRLAVVLTAVPSSRSRQAFAQQSVQPNVVPVKKVFKLSMDKRYETVSGDPAKAGAPFAIRIHAEAGYIIMPHTHPEDENIVVVKGSWALGMGDRFNRGTLQPMEVGDYGFASKKMAHFGFSRTDTIIQVHGIGPFTTQWVVPVYELTDKGVLLKASAGDAGSLIPTAPEGCFALKLSTPVRGSYGEGVVVGAQCTPDQLTQYRVERPDGERFWAQRDELNTP